MYPALPLLTVPIVLFNGFKDDLSISIAALKQKTSARNLLALLYAKR